MTYKKVYEYSYDPWKYGHIRAERIRYARMGAQTRALRSTISHAKQIIGKVQTCRNCHAKIRSVYLFTSDSFRFIDDPGENHDGPLTTHECGRAGEA